MASRVAGPTVPSTLGRRGVVASTSLGISPRASRTPATAAATSNGARRILIESRRTGRDDQGAQIAPPDRREAAVGDGGQVEREGRLLIERQQVPAAVERGAQPLPAQRAQTLVLDRQQDPQPVVVGGFGSCPGQGVAYLLAEQRLAEDRAVRLRLDARRQQRASRRSGPSSSVPSVRSRSEAPGLVRSTTTGQPSPVLRSMVISKVLIGARSIGGPACLQ